MKERITVLILLVMIMIFSYISLLDSENLRGNISLKYKVGDVGFEDKDEIRVTSWSLDEDKTVYLKELNRLKIANIISIYGDTELLVNDEILYGANSFEDDMQGCIVSKKMSEEMFGVSNAIGKKLTYQNKDYIVRGIMNSEEMYMIIHDEKRENGEYNFYELKIANDKDAAKVKCENYLAKQQYNEATAIVDYNFLVGLCEVLFLMPIILLIGVIIVKIGKNNNCFWIYAVGTVIIVTIIATNVNFGIDFIPTRWSDFEFWSNKVKYIKENFNNLNGFKVCFKEVRLYKNIIKIFIYSNLSIAMMVIFILKRTKYEKNERERNDIR